MSNISFPNFTGMSLASSVSGGQQARPDQNSKQAEAAKRDLKATLDELSARTTEDVDEPTLSADRDADGRNLAGFFEEEPAPHAPPQAADSKGKSSSRPADPDEKIGRLLDLDA